MTTLKTCPFCDSTPQVNNQDDKWWVECSTCGAVTGFFESEDEGIFIWNDAAKAVKKINQSHNKKGPEKIPGPRSKST